MTVASRLPKNLLAWNQELSRNGPWSNAGYPCVVADGATSAPNGSNTGSLITASGGANFHMVLQSKFLIICPGMRGTVTAYMKKGTSDYGIIGDDRDGSYHCAIFNLNTGAYSSTYGNLVSYNIYPVGNGWHKVLVSFQSASSTGISCCIGPASIVGVASYIPAATPESVYAWRPQSYVGIGEDDSFLTTEVPRT